MKTLTVEHLGPGNWRMVSQDDEMRYSPAFDPEKVTWVTVAGQRVLGPASSGRVRLGKDKLPQER